MCVPLWIVIIKILEEFYFIFVAHKGFSLAEISEYNVKGQLPSLGHPLVLQGRWIQWTSESGPTWLYTLWQRCPVGEGEVLAPYSMDQ